MARVTRHGQTIADVYSDEIIRLLELTQRRVAQIDTSAKRMRAMFVVSVGLFGGTVGASLVLGILHWVSICAR